MFDLMKFQQSIAATYDESVERVNRCVDFVIMAICDNYDFAFKKHGRINDADPLKKPFDAMAPIFDPDARALKAEPEKVQEPCPILSMTVINYDKPIISAEIKLPYDLHLDNATERELFDELLKRSFHRLDMNTCSTKISKSNNLHDILTVDFTYDEYVPVKDGDDEDFFKSRLIYAFGDTPEGIKKGNDPRPVAVMSTINASVLIYVDEHDSTFRVDVWKANLGRNKEEEAKLKYSINGIEEYARAVLVARELCHLNGFVASNQIAKMLHKRYSYCSGIHAYVMPKYDADAIKYGMNEDTGAAILNKDNDDDNVMAEFDSTDTANIICGIINYTPRQ